jgi:hypothetical protein
MKIFTIGVELVQVANNEDIGLKSALVAALVILSSVIVFLYRSAEARAKEKDEKILKLIEENKKDLKEANADQREIINKYHEFTQHLKQLVSGK